MEINEIMDLIEQDIRSQQIQIQQNVEIDKSLKWRIEGMELLKERILHKLWRENRPNLVEDCLK